MTENHYHPLEANTFTSNEEVQWICLSDLMTGMMLLFMLIALAFMIKVEADASKARQVAVIYDAIKRELYDDLNNEFKNDLPAWGAEISKDLTIRFKEPEVLFNTGKDALKPKFQDILASFFPRYVKIITSEKYKDSIQEIRIEGHTSTIWNGSTSPDEAYYLNMELSQSRTRSTLRFLLSLPEVQMDVNWLRQYVTANGLSSSKLIYNEDKTENVAKSQRVEFRIRTDADSKIATILETMQ